LPIITDLGPFAYNPRVLSGGSRELKSRPPGSWVSKIGAWLDRAAFRPASLPDDLVTGIALLPAIAAGLIIFKLPAVEMLAIALATGTAGLIAAHWLWRHHRPHPGASTLIASLFGVALVGAGAPLLISVEIALLAVVLEILRARYMPAIRAQSGLIAFVIVALATRGAPFTYFDPNGTTNPRDPIDTWYQLFHQSSWGLDPIRLYVGNVPGPVFATSLLAVAVGVAWLAYARRMSLVVLLAFAAGAMVAIYTFHWDPLFQLDSGPTWFVAGLLLADRRLLPESWALRPMLGIAGGLFAIGLRRNGSGIEAAFFTVAALQAVMAVIVIVYWAGSVAMERWKRTRRLRQREANLRVVKTISRAS
jgi:Na+-transporting NADH:ubiquinone oxidoreductase subunit NqrB